MGSAVRLLIGLTTFKLGLGRSRKSYPTKIREICQIYIKALKLSTLASPKDLEEHNLFNF